MTTRLDQTLEASISVLAKHGIRRTSMNDIADAAGVSRQTLYSQFGNKEGIVQAVIVYATGKTIATIETQWQSSDSLESKLDVYHQHAVVANYQILQSMPDAADLFSPEHPMVAECVRASEGRYVQVLEAMLQPFQSAFECHDETPGSIAAFIVTASYAMKNAADSVADLQQKINTLQRMVLLMAGQSRDSISSN